MKINNIHTPVAPAVKKISSLAENLNAEKDIFVDRNGRPIEFLEDSFNDKKAAAILQESWGFARAKDAINVALSKIRHNKK